MKRRFLDECDNMINQISKDLRDTIHTMAAAGVIQKPEEIENLCEAKAALCVALRREVGQWRPLGGETADERRIYHSF